MKKLKKFLWDWTKVEIEWETFSRSGKFEFSLIHIAIIIALLIYIWTR